MHKQLGYEFLEAVNLEALAIELETRDIPFNKEVELPVFCKGYHLSTYYRADYIFYE
ncbi:MAG: GxxExxY protein [Calditrichaeota bacterium]|nr:GxxExxY protein [Calditrichota bacterium]MBT7618947.1 GxxExxY protein [Calditrichota bacterium]